MSMPYVVGAQGMTEPVLRHRFALKVFIFYLKTELTQKALCTKLCGLR